MKEKKLFGILGQYPEFVPPEESQKLIDEAIKNLQLVERNYMGREVVTMGTRNNDPLMVVCASDLHAGAITTDGKMIEDLKDYVMNHNNVGVVLLGDEVEGLKEAYLNTNTARTPIDFHQQIDYMRTKFLEPLASKGKVLAMVSGYWGHPGWAEDATTINTWRMMTDGLDIPVLQNGGQLRIKFPNGHVQSMSIWHNPPSASRLDPVQGLREAAWATDESVRTDGYMSGHIHQVSVGKELFLGAKGSVYFISSGTAKGSSERVPQDRFGVKMGLSRTDPIGQGVILEPRRRSQTEKNYPFVSLKQGQVAFKAISLLNKTEQLGITTELLEKTRAEIESKPTIILVSGKSHVKAEEGPVEKIKNKGEYIKNPYSGMRMRAPYESLTYNIETQLPIALHLISNARLGSSSEGYDYLKRYHRELVAGNPHSLEVILRNMIDKDAGKSPQRMQILQKLVDIINSAQEQTLAIMMDESLRNAAWKKSKVEGEYCMPVAPGSYLANETNTPLIHHLSYIKLAIGPAGVRLEDKPMYIGAFPDKLMNSASLFKPTHGLKQIYRKTLQDKPGYVAGGHMPNAGDMMFYDRTNKETETPILVAPGWFASNIDVAGKGNVMPGAEPGQAIIFMPGKTKSDYLAFPTVNESETGYLQDALTLLVGLEKLGLTEQVLGSSKGR